MTYSAETTTVLMRLIMHRVVKEQKNTSCG